MIVRDLLIKLGFKADTAGLDKTDRQIGQLKASTIALGQVMADLAQKGIGAAVDEMQKAAEASIEFGRGMANVGSIMGAADSETLKMAETAKALGKEFGVMPKDISAAMYDVVGSLGYTADTVDQVRMAVKLGKAGAASTSEGFAVLSAVTKAYGDTSAKTMEHVGDLASAAVRLGVLTMPELAASIQQVTPSASALGVTLEELFNVQSTLSGTTGSAAEVYTQMQSAMTGLLKRTKPMEAAFAKAFGGEGIKTMKEAISKYGLQGALEKLVATTDGTQEELVDLFGRVEAVRFALAVTGNQATDYKNKLKEMHNVVGEVDKTVQKQTTGMGANAFALDKAKAAAEAQRIELGDQLAPAYIQLYELGSLLANLFGTQIVPLFMQTTDGIEDMGDATEGLSIIFTGLKSILGIVLNLTDAVMSTFIGGIKAISVGIAAITSGDFELIDKFMKEEAPKMRANLDARLATREAMIFNRETPNDAAKRRRMELSNAQNRMAATSENAQASRAGWENIAVPSYSWNVGNVAVNVSVPDGTTAAAAARVGSEVVREVEAQSRLSAQRGFPVQGPIVDY